MRRVVVSTILAIVLGLSGIKLSAGSPPVPTGAAAGIELCPAFLCGFALFVGQFQGEVNSRPADGFFSAKVFHEDLQPVGVPAAIFDGQFTITAGPRIFRGDIGGGTIVRFNEIQFCVRIELDYNNGGQGHFTGILDHGEFPPTIAGLVTEEPGNCF